MAPLLGELGMSCLDVLVGLYTLVLRVGGWVLEGGKGGLRGCGDRHHALIESRVIFVWKA